MNSWSSSQFKSPQQIIPTCSIPSGDSQQLEQSSLAPIYQLNLEVYLWIAKSIVNELNDLNSFAYTSKLITKTWLTSHIHNKQYNYTIKSCEDYEFHGEGIS